MRNRRSLLVIGVLASVALAARLIMAGGGTTFVQPDPEGFAITAAGDGGWPGSTCAAARAIQRGGYVYLGYVDKAGNAEIVVVDDTTGAVAAGPITLHAALEVDWHDAPAVAIRDDGRLITIYSKHAVAGGGMYVRISTNPVTTDPLLTGGFGAEANIDSQLGGDRYTYPALFVEPSGKIWLFYRDTDLTGGETSRWAYSTSTDNGVTWAAQTIFYRDLLQLAYMAIDFDGVDRFDIATTNDTGAGSSMYHFYLTTAGGKFKTDGSTIATAFPLASANVTLVHAAAGGARFAASVVSAGGFPVITWPEFNGGGPKDYYYAKWDGSAWTSHNVIADGTTGAPWVEGGFVLDTTDPAYAYNSRSSGGHYDVYRGQTPDYGATWNWVQLATSATDDFYPIVPRDPDRLRAFWLRRSGTTPSFTDYDLQVMGVLAA